MGLYVLAFMFVGAGALLGLSGWVQIRSNRRKSASWLRVQGTVVRLEAQGSDRGRTLYAPVYQYFADGEHTGTSTTASAPPDYKVGDPVDLLVDPVNVGKSEIVDSNTALFSYGPAAAGAVCLAFGLLVLWLLVLGRAQ